MINEQSILINEWDDRKKRIEKWQQSVERKEKESNNSNGMNLQIHPLKERVFMEKNKIYGEWGLVELLSTKKSVIIYRNTKCSGISPKRLIID